ncbi:MAG: hypothetical protein J3Q66DRAFT_187514 [Benniella sp.]|nr:MAG: hypothetical protein J3Q66DRAFT_187514 [Benniella sp.]
MVMLSMVAKAIKRRTKGSHLASPVLPSLLFSFSPSLLKLHSSHNCFLMDSFFQAGHPTLAAFPLGLGLTAAAHIHLCQRTLHKATLKRDYCVQRQSLLNPDQFALTIAESMNQMVVLVDDIILRFQDSLPRPRRRHDAGKTHSRRTRDRRNSLVTTKRTTARFRDSRRLSEDSLPILWTHSTPLPTFKDVKGKGIATTVVLEEEEEETAHQEGLPLHTLPEESQEAESSGPKRPKTTTTRPPRRKPTAVHVSVESLETWSNTYRTLRRIQERHSKNVFQRQIKSDPMFVKLQGNALFMFFLGGITTLRHLITTTGFKSLLAKCSWIPGFEWFTWANISPPRSSYIPWGLAQRSGKHVGTGGGTAGGTADVTAVAGGTITGSNNNSNVSTAFAFLPLIPTLLVAGMHFVAALRTQWSIRQIEKENQRQTHYARQLGVMAMFLLIREQRLGWLAEKIRDFEEEEATKSGDTTKGAGGEDNDEDFEDVPDEEEAETHGPNMADTAAFINSLQHHEAMREDYHNTNIDGQEDGSSNPPRRGRIQLVDPKVLVLTFGPNLEKMDMQQFLMNPMERNRILRLEFEGMRDELVLFRQNMIHAGQVIH